MQNTIDIASLQHIDGEARILDTVLASRLEYIYPRQIREIIARNRDELEAFGSLSCGTTNSISQGFEGDINPLTSAGGRPGKAYWLNEGQALVICALSRTPKAAEVRKQLIEVFMAWRAGKLVHVKEHRRRLPNRPTKAATSAAFDKHYNFLMHFIDQPTALVSVLADCLVRLDQLEA